MIYTGDCLTWLRGLPSDSVDLVFTSPPYEDARLYLEDGQDMGIARGTEEWVAWMVEVVTECVRVCKGLCAFVVEGRTRDYSYSCAPFLLMADLRRAGFTLRKPPVYHRVGIPGSGGPDWWRNDWEPIVCVTKGGKLPWSDNTATGAPPKYRPGGPPSHRTQLGERVGTRRKPCGVREIQSYKEPEKANPGNIIRCKVGGGLLGSDLAHENEAPFPESLAEPFVLSFCPPDGTVLDPFCGSGTTLAVAAKHGRKFLGCDLRPSQVALSARRLAEVQGELWV